MKEQIRIAQKSQMLLELEKQTQQTQEQLEKVRKEFTEESERLEKTKKDFSLQTSQLGSIEHSFEVDLIQLDHTRSDLSSSATRFETSVHRLAEILKVSDEASKSTDQQSKEFQDLYEHRIPYFRFSFSKVLPLSFPSRNTLGGRIVSNWRNIILGTGIAIAAAGAIVCFSMQAIVTAIAFVALGIILVFAAYYVKNFDSDLAMRKNIQILKDRTNSSKPTIRICRKPLRH